MRHDTGSWSPRAQANRHLTRVAALAVAALVGAQLLASCDTNALTADRHVNSVEDNGGCGHFCHRSADWRSSHGWM
ncbi:uncharacterized protein SAZU_4665 [Streptomyces azureus]|uniref:Uncharacterized protein n=1 Tax=Streptomyces azureus TaxID=146537 RepID=A0A0K8PPW1_STRAJ|nr:uncharacterized protein SAZU_4665 [Streptomyces azureus]